MHRDLVSIPFKRESVSKGNPLFSRPAERMKFQFPSDGKAYPKLVNLGFGYSGSEYFVSIPFKRESVSKETFLWARIAQRRWFPFPSNGKAYPKLEYWYFEHYMFGFHSLQTGKRIQRSPAQVLTFLADNESFNSLQTGKRIQSYPQTDSTSQ